MSSATLISPQPLTLTGQYFLKDVMETVSGFKFNADATFEFFYSYGAIKRTGSGTYTIKDNHIILFKPRPSEKDFRMINCKHNSFNGVTIKILYDDPLLIRYVSCCIGTADGMIRKQSNDLGIAQFPKQQADSILLLHLLFPDRTSIFQIENKNHNYFEFAIEPFISNVCFNHLTLKISKNELTGGHPLIQGNQYVYEKE